MKKKYFGTDGIRGKVGSLPITPEFFVKLGYAAGIVLSRRNKRGQKPSVVIGKDTRISGYMLESALEAGFSSAGVNVFLTGPIPTPAIAYLTRSRKADFGVIISASHNPYDDNGVKFFSSKGLKLSDEIECEIESLIDQKMEIVLSNKLGKAQRAENYVKQYIEFCENTFSRGLTLKGLTIVLDCANGATYHIAPTIFSALGANIIVVNDKPNGLNINKKAGSIHPKSLQSAVVSHNADMGIAFDGDGDRVIMVDQNGTLVDGDQLLYLIAQFYIKEGYKFGGVVGTHMTNLAFEERCKMQSIPFVRANVGDRYVSAELDRRNWLLGGEGSGHIIVKNLHTTGDGIISALQVLSFLVKNKRSLKDALEEIKLYPQILINIPTENKVNLKSRVVKDAIKESESIMKGMGRVLIRASGTQPLVRVMTEGPARAEVSKAAKLLTKTIEGLI
ncbi:MAG: phosphoglucosamine mutase [Nitrosomonadales bacterium]|nr:phosphoglucosamine mutase [Nitrosomonadales bacterium]MBT6603205.1 phosphoglucosamine mutase [Nitrosomonadales bacterium]MBT7120241.1 phosphoglucosamine mutase [Nitrosomonadales bacterium]